ncbi:uncharacterized protein LOC128873590 [Hylaeus volcanicus]|uniref:uncharacterized protein LOC128873590 n=1 Tax=Hylaeus volcanicus TaxID=313075 RepID=UPI0023B7C6BC|nr:uncharacterized protein LOC128873590 [Hylaeus volcanicus]
MRYSFLPVPTQRFKRSNKENKMRLVNVNTLAFLWAVQVCTGIVVESNGTVLTRVARTLPFDLSSSRWSEMLRTLWSGGRLWEWPRNSIEGLVKLVASPDTRKKMVFEFRPDDGPRASYAYQARYGYRGRWLIELLGSGFHPDDGRGAVSIFQPLPATILLPPSPPPL